MSLQLAVALDGAGWHPAAWRSPHARPRDLFGARYWVDLAREAEAGLLDFLTIEDSFGMQSAKMFVADDRTDQVRGRLDASLVASLLAPLTTEIGLVPTINTTHTEPFHVASTIATIDHASGGRGGWRAQLSARPEEAALVGRRTLPALDPTDRHDPGRAAFVAELFDEAADAVEVVRLLWDSWEDDAIIRDVATGRFVDRDRLHYIDFEGRFFSVKGPAIVPRSPQGQPLVVALAHSEVPYQFAARSADIVFITPHDPTEVRSISAAVRAAEREVGRTGTPLRIWADLVVFVDDEPGAAAARKDRLDDLDGRPYRSDALIFTGTPGELAELLGQWQALGLDGFRLRPGELPHDLLGLTRGLVPTLQADGRFHRAYEPGTLRERFGLGRPASRYARAGASA
jgi:alkanesulfonate monooxygenase SsuD/methylene tetrahydromethanopterin reductase-like flavin-dependent oxidoreductase (luciferase family)